MDQDQKIKIKIWKKLFQGSREHLLENEQDEPLPELSDEWLTDEEKKNKRRRLNKEKTRFKRPTKVPEIPMEQENSDKESESDEETDASNQREQEFPQQDNQREQESSQQPENQREQDDPSSSERRKRSNRWKDLPRRPYLPQKLKELEY